MKQKKLLLVITVCLVLLLGAAFILYENLSGSFSGPSLAVDPAAQEETADSGSEPASEKEDPAAETTQEDSGQVAEDTTAETQEDVSKELTPAPDFTVYDAEGNAHNLSSFEGKPVIVNFWASWCGPCQIEMPDFETAYAKYGEDVHFLMVNLTDGSRETLESATSFITDNGYSFPVYYDTDSDAAATYAVYSIPTTYFIDSDGYLIARGQTALDLATLEEGIGLIQKEG